MSHLAAQALRRVVRAMVLLVVVACGTVTLMHTAPGYFTDAAELDAQHGATVRGRLEAERASQGSVLQVLTGNAKAWMHGGLGESRQYRLPVSALLRQRAGATVQLLARGIAGGWLLALLFALPASLPRSHMHWLSLPATLLLAVPAGALATTCLVLDQGGPALVLTLVIAARDFPFARRLLGEAWSAPHLLQARAAGFNAWQLLRGHLLPAVLPQMRTLGTMSLVTALSALVPVEVLFDTHGLAQLAWGAALNRDLPVLLAVTLLMAAAVSVAAAFSGGSSRADAAGMELA